MTGTYRGVAVEQHLRPKARLECIVGDEHASTVTDTIGRHGGDRYFVFVVSIEGAYPTDTVKLDEEVVA